MSIFFLKYSSLLTGIVWSCFIVIYDFHLQNTLDIIQLFYTPYVVKICGAFIIAILSEYWGRKLTFLCLGIPQIISSTLLILYTFYEKSEKLLYYGNVCVWFLEEGCMVLLPVYIAEIAKKSNRGSYGSLIFLTAYPSWLVHIFSPSVSSYLITTIICVALLGQFYIFGLESPYYYMAKNKKNLAKITLEKMRNANNEIIDQELEEIEGKSDDESDCRQKRLLKIFGERSILKAVYMTGGLIVLCVLIDSHPVVLTVMESWLTINKYSDIQTTYGFATKIISIFQLLGLLSCTYFVEKLGRKRCLYISCTSVITSLMLIGSFWSWREFGEQTTYTQYFSLFGAILYSFSFSFGIGPLPLILLGEVFPSKYKSLYVALILTFRNLQLLLEELFMTFAKPATMLIVWRNFLCGLLLLTFVKFCVMETGGLSLQEIQNTLKRTTKRNTSVINLNVLSNNEIVENHVSINQ